MKSYKLPPYLNDNKIEMAEGPMFLLGISASFVVSFGQSGPLVFTRVNDGHVCSQKDQRTSS